MIPFGLTAEQFTKRYRHSLEKASPFLINQLQVLYQIPVPQTITAASVEIFLSDSGYDAPSASIYFDGKNKKVAHTDTSIFPGRAMDIPLGLEKAEEVEQHYYQDDNFPGLVLMAKLLKEWFAECWWKAGGWAYPLSVYVIVHDALDDEGQEIALTEIS